MTLSRHDRIARLRHWSSKAEFLGSNSGPTIPLVKILLPFLTLFVWLACAGFASAKEPAKSADNLQYLKIPNEFMHSRMMQSASGSLNTYRVVISIPPTANPKAAQPRIVKSSGRSEVDAIAFDYAREMVKTSKLRDMVGTKELVFPLLVAPPAIDSTVRSPEGWKPIPPGKDVSFPSAGIITYDASTQMNSRSLHGKMRITFPAAGGYAKETCILSTSGDHHTDAVFLRYRLANWQTSRKSNAPQVLDVDFGVQRDPHRPLSW